MIHEILPVGMLQCMCSVVGDETTHEAMVIDPGGNVENIMDILRKHGLTVRQIVITHAHIDHISGAMQLKRLTGASVLLNQNDHDLLNMMDVQAQWLGVPTPEKAEVDTNLANGDTLRVGSLSAQVLHTPGHTQGSVCLYFQPQKILLAGDTLFAGSVGRTDLPGGSYTNLIRSLHDRVLPLPDDTVVIAGHGPSTTIGEERENNPYLQG